MVRVFYVFEMRPLKLNFFEEPPNSFCVSDDSGFPYLGNGAVFH